MLGELNYYCVGLSATKNGLAQSSADLVADVYPTARPSSRSSVYPSPAPTQCHVQYMFLKVDMNPMPECQSYSNQSVSLCGYAADAKGNYVASKLWSNNAGQEANAGLGLVSVTGHAISSKSFVQINGASLLVDLAFDVHSAFGETDYIFYGSHSPGLPYNPNDGSTVLLLRSNQMGRFMYLPVYDGFGSTVDYRNYPYLFLTSADPSKTVLLFQIRYRCQSSSINKPSASPESTRSNYPTNAPIKGPSSFPTASPEFMKLTKMPA